MLLEAGYSGRIDIYRNETPVFLGGTIDGWATGKVMRGEQPEQLRRK
jgi:hypothetical protein